MSSFIKIIILCSIVICVSCDFFPVSEGETDILHFGPPGNIIISEDFGALILDWSAPEDAAAYEIFWTDDNYEPELTSNRITVISGTQYIHSRLNPDKTYKYKLHSIDIDNNPSSLTETYHGSPLVTDLPEIPGSIDLEPDEGSIEITWNHSDTAVNYKIYWTDDGSSPTENSNSIDLGYTYNYIHESLSHFKTYSYALQAINYTGESALSAVESASPLAAPLTAPVNVTVSGSSSLVINWTDTNEDDVVYSVYRRQSSDSYGSVIATDISSTGYTDNSTASGAGYYYKVRAHSITDSRISGYSNEVYRATWRTINENERNNQDTFTTIGYFAAESSTLDLDQIVINGGYSSAYDVYSAAWYKYYDFDCFKLDLNEGDSITFSLVYGTMTGLWCMTIDVMEVSRSYSGNLSEGAIHTFNSSSDSYNYQSSWSDPVYLYLRVNMPDDLINTGPYNYSIRIIIDRE